MIFGCSLNSRAPGNVRNFCARSELERTLAAFCSVSYVPCEIGSVPLNTLPSRPSSSEFFRRASDVANASTPSSDSEENGSAHREHARLSLAHDALARATGRELAL